MPTAKKNPPLREDSCLTGSVRGNRFHRADEVATVAHQIGEPIPIERHFLVHIEDLAEEVLLALGRCAKVAGDGLLHSEARLILTAARFVRIEVSHCAESVEQGFTTISSAPSEQLGQAPDSVERTSGETVGLLGDPASEERTSLIQLDWNLIRDLQRLLELGGDTDELVDCLLHVLNLGHQILRVPQLETELAGPVAHRHRERVRADNAGAAVHAVQIRALVDAVEQGEPILELTITHLECIKIGLEFDGHEAAATVENRSSRLDHCTSSADSILHDLPETLVRHGAVSLRNRLADRLAVVGAAEVAPSLQLFLVLGEQRLTLDVERERIREVDNGNDLSHAVPRHLKSGLNVTIFNVCWHTVFSFWLVVESNCGDSVYDFLCSHNNFSQIFSVHMAKSWSRNQFSCQL